MLVSLIAFTAAATLIVLLPGPDTLVVVRSLLRGGRRDAARTVVGILCGLMIWVTAAALGLSAVLRASEAGYTTLRVLGAVYLIWLGAKSLLASRRGSADATDKPQSKSLLGTGYLAGLATDLLNPKVGVFFVSFLPGFIPSGYSVTPTALLFGAIFVVLTALYFAALLLLAGGVLRWFNDRRIRRRLDRLTGIVLIGFGARLAFESG